MNKKSKSTLEKFEQKLRFRNYSEQTIRTYVNYASKFLSKFDKDIYHIPVKEAKAYLENYNYSSVSQQNQIISSIKNLYKEVVGSKLQTLKIERPRKNKNLPKVIDKAYLVKSISGIQNIKHKSILMLGYSCGLRVSEVINIKIIDIQSDRGLILIENAKGNKDRFVPLSKELLKTLRAYFLEYKPVKYLFNGHNSIKYSATSCNKIVKKYLGSQYHFHQLRHSSFTAMLESGTDIRIIQKVAGHKSSKTTEIYTHISNQFLSQVATPM